MLELLLRVGADSSIQPITLPCGSNAKAHGMRAKFYSLRAALNRERYEGLATVHAVRLVVRGTDLVLENSNKLSDPTLDAALDAGIAQLQNDGQ